MTFSQIKTAFELAPEDLRYKTVFFVTKSGKTVQSLQNVIPWNAAGHIFWKGKQKTYKTEESLFRAIARIIKNN